MDLELRDKVARAMFDGEFSFDAARDWEEWATVFRMSAGLCIPIICRAMADLALAYEDEFGGSGEVGRGIATAILRAGGVAATGRPAFPRPAARGGDDGALSLGGSALHRGQFG